MTNASSGIFRKTLARNKISSSVKNAPGAMIKISLSLCCHSIYDELPKKVAFSCRYHGDSCKFMAKRHFNRRERKEQMKEKRVKLAAPGCNFSFLPPDIKTSEPQKPNPYNGCLM